MAKSTVQVGDIIHACSTFLLCQRCSRTDWAGETVSLKIREDVVTPGTTSLLDP